MGTYGQDWASYQPAQPDIGGLGFAFVKVTQGQTYVNPLWPMQARHAAAGGLVLGLYHYPEMGNGAIAEVRRFLSVVTSSGLDLTGVLLMLDWEGYDQANLSVPHGAQAVFKDVFLQELKAARPTNRTVLYCNIDYWRNVDTSGQHGDALFIAEPGSPGAASIQTPWLFHQYDTATVDRDYCPLTLDQLRAWAHELEDDMTPEQAQQLADVHKAVVEPSLKSLIDGAEHTLGEHELATNRDAHAVALALPTLQNTLGEIAKTLGAIAAKVGA
jgi:hypothetical protein